MKTSTEHTSSSFPIPALFSCLSCPSVQDMLFLCHRCMLEPPARKGTLLQARNLGVWETGHFQQFPNLVLSIFVVLVVCVSPDPLCQPPLSPETQQGTTDSLSCVFDGLGCCIPPGNTPGKLGDTACSPAPLQVKTELVCLSRSWQRMLKYLPGLCSTYPCWCPACSGESVP